MVDIQFLLLLKIFLKHAWASLVLSQPLTKEPNLNFSCFSGRARKCFPVVETVREVAVSRFFHIKYWVTSSVVHDRSQSPGFPVKKLELTDICKRSTWRTSPRKHVKYVAKTFTKDKPAAVKTPHYLKLLP